MHQERAKNKIKIESSAIFSAFFSAIGFCWLASLLFGRPGGPDCWPSHCCSDVNWRKSCYQLVRVVFVEQTNKFSKVLHRLGLLPDIFFFQIVFLRD